MAKGETYEEFVEKFKPKKPKKTTDDCYTPPLVYEAVKNWAVEDRGWQGREIVRPFYPGGDYEHYDYPENCVVIDNPPFSIITKIVRFYEREGIDFFLFAPNLTLFNIQARSMLCVNFDIVYENGARVSTSFVCSEGARIRSVPTLYKAVKEANDTIQKARKVELPKYKYPPEVLTSARVGAWSQYGVDYEEDNAEFVRRLDAQREAKKSIFGAGFLVPPEKAIAAAEKAAAEKAVICWELSEREREIVQSLRR